MIHSKYNRKQIFKRANYLARTTKMNLSEALKYVWADHRSRHAR